ncbi:hypothetical protein SLA2020_009920 [Shorea laevis]
MNSMRSRRTSGRRGRQDTVDLACDVTPVMGRSHTQSISPQGFIHVADSSHKERQKGRGPNKPKKLQEDQMRNHLYSFRIRVYSWMLKSQD